MKVLHCIYSLKGGGAERQLSILASQSDAYGVESAVFCVSDEGYEQATSALRVYNPDFSSRSILKIFSGIRSAIRDFKPDLVHAWLPPIITIPALLSARFECIPCITSYRNRMFFDTFLRRIDFLFQFLLSKKIISNNPVEQSSMAFQWLYRVKNGQTISNAMDVSSEYRGKALENKNNKRLIFVGRLTKQKNLRVVIEALAKLDGNHSFHLDVFGVGEREAELVSLVRNDSLDKIVHFHGYAEDIYEEMSEGGVLILPSLYEGMPNVLVEAMACGLPVICSDIPSVRFLLESGDEAILFDPKSVDSLVDVLTRIQEGNIDLSDIAKNGLNLSEKFKPSRMIESYRAAYSSVTN